MENIKLLAIFGIIITILWFNIGIANGIINGKIAEVGQFKYLVSLQARRNGKAVHTCGAAIISDQHIITAAHCIIDDQDKFKDYLFSIIVGITSLKMKTTRKIEIDVTKVYVPMEYRIVNPNSADLKYRMKGDIAILLLMKKLVLDKDILEKLNLPTLSSYENEEPIISGFGADRVIVEKDLVTGRIREKIFNEDCNYLRYTDTLVISNKMCNKVYTRKPLTNNHLCAQAKQVNPSKPTGVCKGDSGGPLVLNANTLIGILSSSPPGCDERDRPAIYTRVSSYLWFINKAVKDESSPNIRIATYQLDVLRTKHLVEI